MNDSTKATQDHIAEVGRRLSAVVGNLVERASVHDASKLLPPEKECFDEISSRLKDTTYGSDEYRATLREYGHGIKHHQENNSHHPEFYIKGIAGMSLLDLIEMIADWKAASMRHNDGDIRKSIQINKERFNISDELASILHNTIEELGWE